MAENTKRPGDGKEGKRPCPVCGETMVVEKRQGITIDACPDHGIWLDKGELPAVAEAIGHRRGLARRLRTLRRAGRPSAAQRVAEGVLVGWWTLLFD